MAARVSVVVPVYNVADYLEACLESIAQQTFSDLEVVMVDDGSTDESPQIAERFAARDSRFRLVHQENAGLGAARNTGAAQATGEFLAFADSDDVLVRNAYELLLEALDQTGSDFASGNVRRLTSRRTTKAAFLARAFERTRLRTHITRFPPLLADRTAWNKLFRRSFWDEHGLRFPVGVYYEDTPVTLPAHYLARSVDVLDQPVYLWRTREGGELSITQRRTEPKALRDRVAAVDHVSRFLAERGLHVSKALYDRSVLGQDLRFFLDVLARADEDYRRLYLDLANDFIDRAHEWALEQPFAIDRLKWQLVRRRALPELLEVLRFEDEELGRMPPIRKGRHWYGDYPYRTDERLAIPAKTYRLDPELAPVFRVEDVRWDGDMLRVEGYAYVTGIGAPERASQKVAVVARDPDWWRPRLRLHTEPVHRPDVTASAAQELVSLDWAGFLATLDGAALRRAGRWREGTWDLGVVIRTGGVTRTSWRFEPTTLRAAPLGELDLEDGTHIRVARRPGGKLAVQVQRRPAVVHSCAVDGGVLQLEGTTGRAGRELELHIARRVGGTTLAYPVHVDRLPSPSRFLARVPLDQLVAHTDPAGAVVDDGEADGVAWDLYLAGGAGRRRLSLDASVAELTAGVGGRQVAVRRLRNGYLGLVERSLRPIVTGAGWSQEGRLLLRGTYEAPAGDYDLLLSGDLGSEPRLVPLRRVDQGGRFEADLDPRAVPSSAGRGPLPDGEWRLLVVPRGGVEPAAEVVLGAELLDQLPISAESGRGCLLGVADEDSATLVVEPELEQDERGGYNQRRLRTSHYSAERSRPLRDVVLYDCFGGRAYADSPRAIHEELVRREAPLEHLWCVRDSAVEVPETAVALRLGSRGYYEAFARSRYVVANDHWPRWFSRRADQTTLQTWHGGPLKLEGRLLADRPKALAAYRRALAERPENWQHVVSPGTFATPILESAFPEAAVVVEAGLPRTDILLHPERDRLAEGVKERLGVARKRVVLYAPTYRDHLDYRSGSRLALTRDVPAYRADGTLRAGYRLGPLIDLAALRAGLDDDHVVFFRRHRLVHDALPAEARGLVRDVSGYPDAAELLLAADVLVTDYSSAIFDFASTGRPIVFFTPDLELFRDQVRGLTLDLESEAPGPLLRTTEEVVAALRDPAGLAAQFREAYQRFAATYCTLQDGGAARRVVDAVFGS